MSSAEEFIDQLNFYDGVEINHVEGLEFGSREATEGVYVMLGALQDRDDYDVLCTLLSSLAQMSLLGEIPRLLKSQDEYWDSSREYVNRTQEERSQFLREFITPEIPTFDLMKIKLWKKGSGVVDLGLDHSAYANMLLSKGFDSSELHVDDNCIETAVKRRLSTIGAVMIKLLSCAPEYYSGSKSDSTNAQAVLRLYDDVINDKVNGTLNIKTYKPNKEMGLLAPHTLPTKEWLGATVAQLVYTIFGEGLRVGFLNLEHTFSRILTDDSNSYFTFDLDNGVFSNNVPSLFTEFNPMNDWEWRTSCSTIKEEVKMHMAEHKDDNRDDVRNDILKSKRNFKYEVEESTIMPYLVNLTRGDESVKVLKMFKLGLSSKKEFESNPDYIHIVGEGVADGAASGFYQILLPDLTSILMLPMTLWRESPKSKEVKDKKPVTFSSKYGVARAKLSLKPYVFFLQLSMTYQLITMLDLIKSKEPIDPKLLMSFASLLTGKSKHRAKSVLSNGTVVKSFDIAVKYAALICGHPRGLSLYPEHSKQGERAFKEASAIESNAELFGEIDGAFDSVIQDYYNTDF